MGRQSLLVLVQDLLEACVYIIYRRMECRGVLYNYNLLAKLGWFPFIIVIQLVVMAIVCQCI